MEFEGEDDGEYDENDSPYRGSLSATGNDLSPASLLTNTGEPARRIRPASRRNVARACEQCRTRKTRCSGDQPICALCRRLGKDCVYSTVVDGRLTDKSAKRKLEYLQNRVRTLETALADALRGQTSAPAVQSQPLGASQHLPQYQGHSFLINPGEGLTTTELIRRARPVSTFDENSPDWDPFGVGRLALSQNGALHLYPAATFYSPAHMAPDWEKALEALIAGPVNRPGYLAPYLPFPLAPEHHTALIDLCFSHMLSFGMNSFKDKFIAEMRQDPMGKTAYFSPMLHLAVLGVGFRYFRDPEGVGMYYSGEGASNRGEVFIEKAMTMVMDEVRDPRLSVILGLLLLCGYNVGVMKDPVASSLYAMAVHVALEMRLHRRCDTQLHELGLDVDSDLDIARRDVFGYSLNLMAWYTTYMGQPPLPLCDGADQRSPYIRSDLSDPAEVEISEVFHHLAQLSDFGLQALQTNHWMRAPMQERASRVRAITSRLEAWHAALPDHLQWPPKDGASMNPCVITTHGMYAAYMIILYRPYILDADASPPDMVAEAISRCLSCANDIVRQSEYLDKTHGVHTAALAWKHILFVCGTMLVLQASGLPSVTDAERERALVDLQSIQASLEELSAVWPVAGTCSTALQQLLDQGVPLEAWKNDGTSRSRQ
ncbi:hypothetical protein Q8F55_001085 [Vanrija albida]|uniref:Zn(2)-C6 fungal-type domain-containing protein n=1 Tax=Vanrija albida TaxID=181172 RepID=A0ABR3QG53_9TREE